MTLRDCSSRVAAFLGNLSVVQELQQFDDVEFVGKLRNDMDDPRGNPSGFIAGTVGYTAAYMLFGRVAGDVLSKGLLATSGALGWGQRHAIRLGRSAMALSFELVAGHRSPAAADVHAVAKVEMAGVPREPLFFSPSQRASAERILVGTFEQIGKEWEGGSEGTAGGDAPWFDAPAELPVQRAPQ